MFHQYIKDLLLSREGSHSSLLKTMESNLELRNSPFRIAGPNDPHWPAIKREPRVAKKTEEDKEQEPEGWWVCDMWLLKAFIKWAPDFLPPHSGPGPHPWSYLVRTYCMEDVVTTYFIWEVLKDALEREGLYDQYLERQKLIGITFEMELRGLSLRPEIKGDIQNYARKSRLHSQAALRCIDDPQTNLDSPDQLRKVLYEEFELPVLARTDPSKSHPNGQPGTAAPVLESLKEVCSEGTPNPKHKKAVKFINNLLLSRRNGKSQGYLESYYDWSIPGPQGWRIIHNKTNITGTRFTRQSTNHPNLQNVGTGKEEEGSDGSTYMDYQLRKNFGPRPGYLWLSRDYSNLELRLWAYDCGNTELIESFDSGVSVHMIIFRELWPAFAHLDDKEIKDDPIAYQYYKKTKNGNFSIIYGATERRADATYGIKGAYKIITSRFPEVKAFTNRLHSQVTKRGYIETMTGYRLYIPREDPHKAVSGRIQGTAGSLIGRAMTDCYEALQAHNSSLPESEHVRIILQIHDELLFELPAKGNHQSVYDMTKKAMEVQGERIGIPTPCGGELIESNWAEGIGL